MCQSCQKTAFKKETLSFNVHRLGLLEHDEIGGEQGFFFLGML